MNNYTPITTSSIDTLKLTTADWHELTNQQLESMLLEECKGIDQDAFGKGCHECPYYALCCKIPNSESIRQQIAQGLLESRKEI